MKFLQKNIMLDGIYWVKQCALVDYRWRVGGQMYSIMCVILLLFWTVSANAASMMAPDFIKTDLQGQQVNLSTLLEKGPVLIDFWATYCKPCLKAMPKLEKIHQKYQEKGLTVLGLNEDGPRGQTKVRPFLNRLKITFPIVIDGDKAVFKRFGLTACPSTVLIAQDGEIVLKQVGYMPNYDDELIQSIELLLSKSSAHKHTGNEREKD